MRVKLIADDDRVLRTMDATAVPGIGDSIQFGPRRFRVLSTVWDLGLPDVAVTIWLSPEIFATLEETGK